MTTRALGPDELGTYRAVRLEALSTDPSAFASTYEREAAFDDGEWAARLRGYGDRPGRVFVDEIDGGPAGLVGIGLTEDPGDAVLWGMWVAPAARRHGAGRRLVEAAVRWAADRGAATVTLWVLRGNDTAVRLYEACGFALTGEVETPPDNPCAAELVMRRHLSGP